MVKVKRVLGLAFIVVSALVLLFGCARLFWGKTEQSGRYIRLNIGGPGSKAIGVEEFDVNRVEVELFAPGESVPFHTLTWYAGDGPVSELIPVSEEGEYRIEVTHVGDDNGEPVEAKESTNFNIAALVITVIDIIPGAVGLIEVESGEIIPYDPSIDAVPISTGMLVSDRIEKGGKKNYSVLLTPGATYSVLCMCLSTEPFDLEIYDGTLAQVYSFTNHHEDHPMAFPFSVQSNLVYLTIDGTQIPQPSLGYTLGVVETPEMTTPVTEGTSSEPIPIVVGTPYWGQVGTRGASKYLVDGLNAGSNYVISVCMFTSKNGSIDPTITAMDPRALGICPTVCTERCPVISGSSLYFMVECGGIDRDGRFYFLCVNEIDYALIRD